MSVCVFTLTSALVAIFACLVVAHASTARLVFSMARDRNLPAVLATTTRRGVPAAATLAVGTVALLVGVGLVSQAPVVTGLVNFGALSSYVVLHATVIRYFFVRQRSRRWLIHLVVPVLGIALLLIALVQAKPLTQVIVVVWLAVGAVTLTVSRQAS